MEYREPFLDDVKVTTSILHKGHIAPKDHVFFIAKLKDGNMVYTLYQLVTRKGSTPENETAFIDAMKKKLLSDVLNKNVKT